jgi:hypothetical protein
MTNGVATFELPARAIVTLQGDLVVGQAPFLGTPFNVGTATTTTIQAEDYDKGGEGVAYHDVDIVNRGNKYRVGEGVDLETATDAGAGYLVGWTKPGEWLEYTLNVATAGPQTLQFRVASTGSSGKFHVEIDGVDKTGVLVVPNTGGWQTWATISKSIDLPAGEHVMRVFMDAAGGTGYVGNFNWIKFVPPTTPPPPPGGQTPFKGTPFAVNVGTATTIQAEDFDNGGQGVAFSDTTSNNQGGAYRSTAVDLQATSDAGGGYNVGWTKTGEWLEYTIDVQTPVLASLAFRVAGATSGGTFHAEIDGVNVTGTLAVPNTGGWQNWTTVSKTGINLTAGVHVLRPKMDAIGSTGYVGTFNWIRIV